MILPVKSTPWYRDQGVLASTAFSAFVLAFNLVSDAAAAQITGTLAAAPMLAAVLVARPARVLGATVVAVGAFVVGASVHGIPWDSAQLTRLVVLVASGAVGYQAARVRIREKSQLVGMREVARTAQKAIMAVSAPHHERVEASVRYVSATAQAQIGGDAFETAETGFGLRLLVADARGKGLPAIRTSAITIGAFREWANVEADLGDVLLRMDASVAREVEPWDFVTALVAELDDHGTFRFCSAGHPMPLLVRAGQVRTLGLQPLPPLSLAGSYGYPQVGEVHLRMGDVVLLYTDGLTEARDVAGTFFPVEAVLPELIAKWPTLEGVADGLLDRLRDFVHSDLSDDVAMVLLRPHRAEVGPVDESVPTHSGRTTVRAALVD